MCRSSPCFPTPFEARRLIEEGHGDKLLSTFWLDANRFPHAVLAPKFVKHQYCVFQNQTTGLCSLHSNGLKPIEGRLAHHAIADTGLRESVCRTWATRAGLRVMQTFNEVYDCDNGGAIEIIREHIKLATLRKRV